MKYVFICLLLLTFTSSHSHACRIIEKLTQKDLSLAHSVFLGKLIKFDQSQDLHFVTSTFEVIEVLSGRKIENNITVNLFWSPLTGALDIQKMYDSQGSKMIIGILIPDMLPFKEKNGNFLEYTGGLFFETPPENAWIMQKGCSRPFLYPANLVDSFREK